MRQNAFTVDEKLSVVHLVRQMCHFILGWSNQKALYKAYA